MTGLASQIASLTPLTAVTGERVTARLRGIFLVVQGLAWLLWWPAPRRASGPRKGHSPPAFQGSLPVNVLFT